LSQELVIASTNLVKVRELRLILHELLPEITVYSLKDFPLFVPQDCYFSTFEKNAAHKAVWAAKQLGKSVLSDESGMVVPYLGDERFSLEQKGLNSPEKKLPDVQKLLNGLKGVEGSERTAFLESVLAFAVPEQGLVKIVSGRIEGFIAHKEQGPASFDFASIFVKYEYSKTLAQLSEPVLVRISHRRKACERLVPTLRKRLSS